MLNLRACDVPLRGRGYFLYPALKEFGVDERTFDILAFSIYPKHDPFDYDPSVDEKPISTTVDEKILKDYNLSVKDFVEIDLVEIKDGVPTITKKTEDILNHAFKLRKEFDEKNPNFYSRPCMGVIGVPN